MPTYGQFCAVARSLEVLGDRWSLLLVREVLLGSHRFSEIQRGIPLISRTMLSTHLRHLVDEGVLERSEAGGGPRYNLTPKGEELCQVVRALGTWGMRWLDRDLGPELLDPDFLLWDMQRRVDPEALPDARHLIRLSFSDPHVSRPAFYLRVEDGDVHPCGFNPGFDVSLTINTDLATLTAWWMGDLQWSHMVRAGRVRLEGAREVARAFPTWFRGYVLANVPRASSVSSGLEPPLDA